MSKQNVSRSHRRPVRSKQYRCTLGQLMTVAYRQIERLREYYAYDVDSDAETDAHRLRVESDHQVLLLQHDLWELELPATVAGLSCAIPLNLEIAPGCLDPSRGAYINPEECREWAWQLLPMLSKSLASARRTAKLTKREAAVVDEIISDVARLLHGARSVILPCDDEWIELELP